MRRIIVFLSCMLIIVSSACGKDDNKPEKSIEAENEVTLEKKNVVNFGDSILGNFQLTYGEQISVSALIAEKTGWNVINAGFGGCLMQKHPNESWRPFCMYELADAIVSGDWSEQERSIVKEKDLNLPYYFKDTISVLKETDWNSIDIITIQYGTNDWKFGTDPLILGGGGWKHLRGLWNIV